MFYEAESAIYRRNGEITIRSIEFNVFNINIDSRKFLQIVRHYDTTRLNVYEHNIIKVLPF